MAHALVLLKLLLCFFTSLNILYGMPGAASHLSFSLTHRDAESSPLRSVEADPADLPEDMPLRAIVAAGRALRARASKKREHLLKAKQRARGALIPRLGRAVSYGGEPQGDFYTTVRVGTPPQEVLFLLDTGSEFNWLQCSPCSNCSETSAPRFVYKKSSSFEPIGCDSPLCRNSVGLDRIPGSCGSRTAASDFCLFQVVYADGSVDEGFFSVDSLDLGPQFSKPYVFGCAIIVTGEPSSSSGFFGLDAGPFSFTSQLFAGYPAAVPRKFGYCLPDRFTSLNVNGRLEFGNYKGPKGLKYTPLAPPYSPLGAAYYYVKLKGVTVGKVLIKAVNRGAGGVVAGGGTVFDSGAALTYLVKPLYDALVGEMRRQTAHLGPFNLSTTSLESDLCYKLPANAKEPPIVPTVSIHFAKGVDLELGPRSTLYADHLDGDNAHIYFCLAFRTSTDTENTIGNYQQQNYWVEYNLDKSSLGLAKAKCAP